MTIEGEFKMAEEETNQSVTATQTVDSNPEVDSARALEELKTQVDSLTRQNKQLQEAKHDYYDKVLNGSNTPQAAEAEHRSLQEIRNDLRAFQDKDITPTNLEYCKLVLELDNESRRTTGDSIFLPKGHQVGTVKPEEYQVADTFHDILSDCIDKADNDPTAFNIALSRRIDETQPRIRKR